MITRLSVAPQISMLKNLYQNSRIISEKAERLATGRRINSGKDDPSGKGITTQMQAHYSGLQEAIGNIKDFRNYLEMRDNVMSEQMTLADRMLGLAVRAATNATLTDDERANMTVEAQGYADSIENFGRSSVYLEGGESDHYVSNLLFGPGELDIVWVMDQTGSMGTHLNALSSTAAPQMFTLFEQRKFDLRMAAVGFGNVVNPTNDPDLVQGTLPDTEPLGGVAVLSDLGVGGEFRDTVGAFQADVGAIAAVASGWSECGIRAVYDSAQMFTLSPSDTANTFQFREDAQKIFMVITDADSDDNASNAPAVPQYLKDSLVTDLENRFGTGVQVWTVANQRENGGGGSADTDYTDVVAMTGGHSEDLDWTYGNTTWVNPTVDALSGMGGPYKLYLHWGSESSNGDKVKFKTVTAGTSGLNGAILSTATAAQGAIDTIKSGIQFISDEKTNTGNLMNEMDRMISEREADYIASTATASRIADTDFTREISGLTKAMITTSAAASMLAYANNRLQETFSILVS